MAEQNQALAKRDDFPTMLGKLKGEIARALPKHLNADRMARIALTEFRKNKLLQECEPRSVCAAIIIASQLGLEPGLMGQAYLIPFKNRSTGQYECQLLPGYGGLLDLVRRAGRVKRIEAHVVHEKDKFTYKTGLSTVLEHEPCLDDEPGAPRCAYAIAEFESGGTHVEVMTKREIETIRNRSNSVKSGRSTPWDTDPEEMWRKTLIRRICKFLPKSAELTLATALDDSVSRGIPQSLTVESVVGESVIDIAWTPATDDGEPEQKTDPAEAARKSAAEAAAMRGKKADAPAATDTTVPEGSLV